MTDEIKLHVDGHYEDRIETLLSVEDLVEEVLQALDVSSAASRVHFYFLVYLCGCALAPVLLFCI